ncbi:MAG: hypothetical protein RIR97_1228 [Pseudomonadota bacterium]
MLKKLGIAFANKRDGPLKTANLWEAVTAALCVRFFSDKDRARDRRIRSSSLLGCQERDTS